MLRWGDYRGAHSYISEAGKVARGEVAGPGGARFADYRVVRVRTVGAPYSAWMHARVHFTAMRGKADLKHEDGAADVTAAIACCDGGLYDALEDELDIVQRAGWEIWESRSDLETMRQLDFLSQAQSAA